MAKAEYYHVPHLTSSTLKSLSSQPVSLGWTLYMYVDEAVSWMPINLSSYFRVGNIIFGALAVWASDLQISLKFVKNGYPRRQPTFGDATSGFCAK